MIKIEEKNVLKITLIDQNRKKNMIAKNAFTTQ